MCAVAPSSSVSSLPPEEASAVEWVHTMVRDSGGTKLSLVVEVQNDQTNMTVKSPENHHVLSLWRMNKERRIALWEELQPQLHLQELRLGGLWGGIECPVVDEELSILCPPHSLQEMRELFLYAADSVGDSGLNALASAGCGAQLTSLTLSGVYEVTDAGLKALASAGCGAQLTSLTLSVLQEEVTDSGLKALASAGCGAQLTTLTLGGE